MPSELINGITDQLTSFHKRLKIPFPTVDKAVIVPEKLPIQCYCLNFTAFNSWCHHHWSMKIKVIIGYI